MNNEDEKIIAEAVEFAKRNKNRIAKELTALEKYLPDAIPVSIFMAGLPGAGKTEYSENLIDILEKNKKHKVVRIDADELRKYFSSYNGKNSYLFQGAVSAIVNKIHDIVLDQKQTFLLDGTFSKYEKAKENIDRSLSRNRAVFIFYVYQKPEVAWKFTRAREIIEGRNIPKDIFMEQFLNSRETVNKIRLDFNEKVVIFLVKKNFETHAVEDVIEITPSSKQIDDYLEQRYTKESLEKLL